jgi:hypothetical protein
MSSDDDDHAFEIAALNAATTGILILIVARIVFWLFTTSLGRVVAGLLIVYAIFDILVLAPSIPGSITRPWEIEYSVCVYKDSSDLNKAYCKMILNDHYAKYKNQSG